MGELISRIWNFFESDKVSISRKITIPILIILAIWIIDDVGGFSYRFTNSQKLDYLLKIEKTKEQFQQDTTVCNLLDKMKYDLIDRKNVFDQFLDLFNNQDLFKSESSATNKENSHNQRNQLWHTVSSSLFWIIWLFIFSAMLLILPFTLKKDKLAAILGIIVGIGIMVLLIWLTQWLFGLIPVLFNPYINYTIQFIINIIPIFLLTRGSIKQKKTI